MLEEMRQILSGYRRKPTVGVIGSHSALEVAAGAHKQELETVVVCEAGRESLYTEDYRELFDHKIILDKFADIVKPKNIVKLQSLNTVFVPNRSFTAYVPIEAIENQFKVPIMGSRGLLGIEERSTDLNVRNQSWLLREAGINTPKIFASPKDIKNKLVIVKVQGKKNKLERAFFYANSAKMYRQKADELIKKGIISKEMLKASIIEEVVLGAKFNANFFWSPIDSRLYLLGFEQRIQTDLEGITDLPAQDQLAINIIAQNIEVGHRGVTMRESLIPKPIAAGKLWLAICKKEFPPGMIGVFSLQGALDVNLKFYVFDVAPRVPGAPPLGPTSPYMEYLLGRPMSTGEIIAREIKRAFEQGRLAEIVT